MEKARIGAGALKNERGNSILASAFAHPWVLLLSSLAAGFGCARGRLRWNPGRNLLDHRDPLCVGAEERVSEPVLCWPSSLIWLWPV